MPLVDLQIHLFHYHPNVEELHAEFIVISFIRSVRRDTDLYYMIWVRMECYMVKRYPMVTSNGMIYILDASPRPCYDYCNPYCMVLEEGGHASVQFNLFNWLFTDPVTAGSSLPSGAEEQFHYFWPWLIFCGIGLLICFYYWVEARKRFVKSKPLLKYMFDRYLNWLAIICFIGIPIDLSRIALDQYFFAWRVWRYLWVLAMAIWAVLWILYLVRKYPQERASYTAYQKRSQYIPKPGKRKAKTASR